jgi:hypothetical protein
MEGDMEYNLLVEQVEAYLTDKDVLRYFKENMGKYEGTMRNLVKTRSEKDADLLFTTIEDDASYDNAFSFCKDKASSMAVAEALATNMPADVKTFFKKKVKKYVPGINVAADRWRRNDKDGYSTWYTLVFKTVQGDFTAQKKPAS